MGVTHLTDNQDFYPTPPELAEKMIDGVDGIEECYSVLEPSAGKGDLVESLMKKGERLRYCRDKAFDIDSIELDENLRYMLVGKKIRVIHDDFLTYHGNKRYDLILMNPPFSNGCQHLMKALEMQKHGGKICCLLNAETIRNPYTNDRKALVDLLNKYRAKCKFVENAFKDAERETDVSVVIVWVDIERGFDTSKLLQGLEQAEKEQESETGEVRDLCLGGYVERMISRFNLETKLVKEFIREYYAIRPYIMRKAEECVYDSPVIELKIAGSEHNGLNDAIQKLRLKYWEKLFQNQELMSKFTSDLQAKYTSMINEMQDYDFTAFNIQTLFTRMNAELITGVEEQIFKVFKRFSEQHSWYPECKNNIHYFNGWRTNTAHKVGMKVIVPAYGVFSSWSWDRDKFQIREAYSSLADVEKVLNYLNGRATAEVDMMKQLENARSTGITKNINLKYFKATFYKKGTVHITFHKEFEYLIDALNLYVCRHNNWLPPSYGKKTYEQMDEEEKTVIDEFQGKEKYAQVLANPEIYLYENNKNVLLLN